MSKAESPWTQQPWVNLDYFLFSSEFFAENLGDFFIFLRRFADEILEFSAESLEQILNFITVFMGNVEKYVTTILLFDYPDD